MSGSNGENPVAAMLRLSKMLDTQADALEPLARIDSKMLDIFHASARSEMTTMRDQALRVVAKLRRMARIAGSLAVKLETVAALTQSMRAAQVGLAVEALLGGLLGRSWQT